MPKKLEGGYSQPLKAEWRGSSQYPHVLFPIALPQSSPEGRWNEGLNVEKKIMCPKLGDYQHLLSDDRECTQALEPLHP